MRLYSASLGDQVITMADGTCGSPVCQQAIKYGTDISSHSCLNMMQVFFYEESKHHFRMERRSSNGLKVANYLEGNPKNVHLAKLGMSLGGVITLVQHPASMTYGTTLKTDAERVEAGIKDGIVRIRLKFCLDTTTMSELWHPAKSILEDNPEGLRVQDLSIDTRAISTRHCPPKEEPLVQPIVHSSTYIIPSVDDYLRILQESGYIYGRLGNPTCEAAECAINALEGGAGTLVFASGMAAISSALFGFLKAGDHVVANNPVYSGTFEILEKVLTKFGVEVTWVTSGCPVDEYKKNVKQNTKLLYGETPCNPNMTLLDLEEFGKLGTSLGDHVVTMVDCTFGTPYCQQALKYGIDISMNSCTKYLGGHSDMIAGCLTFKDVKHWKMMKKYQTTLGGILSPHEASLLLRGVKSIHVRMPRHSSNAQKVAEFLENHPKVECVLYPGLPSHPQHDIAKKQMKGFSGMISVIIKGGANGGKAFVENLHIAQLAVSLGGVETLVSHPASMTHGPMLMSDKEREAAGIKPGQVRMSIGLEDPDDLIRDFGMALEKVPV